MENEPITDFIYKRQSRLLERQGKLNDFMYELEQVDNDDNLVTRTSVFRLMELEHNLIFEELDFIENLLRKLDQK